MVIAWSFAGENWGCQVESRSQVESRRVKSIHLVAEQQVDLAPHRRLDLHREDGRLVALAPRAPVQVDEEELARAQLRPLGCAHDDSSISLESGRGQVAGQVGRRAPARSCTCTRSPRRAATRPPRESTPPLRGCAARRTRGAYGCSAAAAACGASDASRQPCGTSLTSAQSAALWHCRTSSDHATR
jgi:hypothetical protein